ncbi:SDR family NAD(P)-dependent oxidoreductase [Aquimarina aquimarini]|nr:SDR family NAD(P)-dependent oxidoreductase [Aquimarina aquimarini]
MAINIIETLLQNTPSKRQNILSDYIRKLLTEFLELDPSHVITKDQSFIELGTDSAQAIEFKLKLEQELDCSLKTTVLFDYPRLDTLVDFLLSELKIAPEHQIDKSLNQKNNSENTKDEIAIIGMACRMPGGIMNPMDFWQLLINNENAIEEVPKSRFDIDQFYSDKKESGKVSSRYGGFIKNIKEFDPQFFGISAKEASEMDPQQRVLMEVAWEAIENSGQSANNLRGNNIGVFVGIRNTEYYPPEKDRDPKNITFFSGMGTQLSAASGRLSYFLGLTGPSLSIDTACSASMTALHYACESIRNNESDGALVGGVNIIISGENNVAASQGNMLSSDGFCKTFSSKADGYVRSEGCAVFYLKPLKKAQLDGDPILSVICATGINQDGASGGLTVPYGPAQENLIRKTLDKANLNPEDIDYVEAHGTGTPLGDPIEVQALNNTIGIGHNNKNPLKIGSVKTNIGHTEPVAGLAGLMKTVLSMQHEMIPSNLHADPPNPYIDWDDMPLKVVTKNTPWYRNEKSRYAGISSFGFTGTNTHAIIKEAPVIKLLDTPSEDKNYFFTCSAKTKKALETQVKNHVNYLKEVTEKEIADVCYTSLTGRNHFQYRISVIENSKEDIINSLQTSFKKESNAFFSKISLEKSKIAFIIPDLLNFNLEAVRFLFNEHPVFRKIIKDCDRVTDNNYKLLESFTTKNDQNTSLDEQDNSILYFTALYAYAKSWIYWGITPDLLLCSNHSSSQILAACISGVFDYKSAIQLLEKKHSFINKADTEKEVTQIIEQIEFSNPDITLATDTSGFIDSDDITSIIYWKNQLISSNLKTNKNLDLTAIIEKHDLFLCIGRPQKISNTISALKEKIILDNHFNQGEYKNQFLKCIQSLYHFGVEVNWINFIEGQNYKKVVLPNYPFQRKYYWLNHIEENSNSYMIPKNIYKHEHPLLGNKIELALSLDQTIRYNGVLNTQYPSFIKDHKVYDKILFPGAGYIEMAFAGAISVANRKSIKHITLSEISFKQSLELIEGKNTTIQTSFSPLMSSSNSRYEFNIHSVSENLEKEKNESNTQWTYHANGILKLENTPDIIDTIDDLDSIKDRCHTTIDGKEHYKRTSLTGLHYGASFQGVSKMWYNENEALTQVKLPNQSSTNSSEYHFHPALLDSCFQSLSALLAPEKIVEALLPISIQSITIFDVPTTELWCYINTPKKIGDTYYQADFHIVNSNGKNIAFINGLKLIRLKNNEINGTKETKEHAEEESAINDTITHSVSWIQQPEIKRHLSYKERMVKDPTSWLILCDKQGIGDQLTSLLEEKQERAIQLHIEDFDFEDIENWKDFLSDEFDESFPKLKGVINLWGIEQSFEQEGLHSSLLLIQSLEELLNTFSKKTTEKPRLWWITKGGQAIINDTEKINPKESTLWGFRASLAYELGKYTPSCIDLDSSENLNKKQAQQLFDEIWNPGPEDQVAFRNGNRYVARLSEYQLKDKNQNTSPLQLRIKEYGTLENLEQVSQNKKAPGVDEVQIAVTASALNFKDVLHTLGLLQEHSEQQGIISSKDQPLGFECSGIVTAVGKNVKSTKIGDKVIATSPNGCMKSFVTVSPAYIVPKPANLSMIEASAIPTVFMTALYGLEELAKIKKGDKVLIHACAGGVGQAALQIAQNAGAIVFATASKSKWDFLKSKGVEYIMDSRSLDYANEINKITNNKGVDIVLNSLKDEYISKNLEVLAKNGRYVEIGKIGIWTKEKMKNTRPDIDYFVFDLGDDIRNNQVLYKKLLLKITDRFTQEKLQTIPITSFDITEAKTAFQYLAQAKNIGKVVLSLPEIKEKTSSPLVGDKNYLITGGLGSLGLKVAEKMADLGAKHISLVGRNHPSSEAKEKIEILEKKHKVNVQVIQSDISIEKETIKLFKTLNKNKISLAGIIHAAGTLQDGVLLQQDWNSFESVMSSKMKGTWNLHTCSDKIDLDFFICFSSMTSVLGGLGQTNYAAANAFMDTFARYRRDLGLPCLSINWGPWAEGGMASNMNKQDQQRIKDMGVEYLSDNQALNTFSKLLANPSSHHIGVWNMNWENYFKNQQRINVPKFLENFKDVAEKSNDQNFSILNLLKEKPVEERKPFFLTYMQKEIAQLMGIDSIDEIDPEQPLFDLGVDSLVTIDLSNRLQKSINQEFNASIIFEQPTLEALTDYILNDLLGLGEEKENIVEPIKEILETNTPEFSEEELAQELSKLVE